MATIPHRYRDSPARQRQRGVTAVIVTGVGRLLRGLLAVAMLAALLAGLPWALVHFIGWPLPHHIPTLPEIQTVLLSPMTTQFLLDLLACVLWLLWAKFTADVVACMPGAICDALHAVSWPQHDAWQRTGPLHTIAGLLVGAIVFSLVGHRSASGPGLAVIAAVPTPPAATGPLAPGPSARTVSFVDSSGDFRAVIALPSMADADTPAVNAAPDTEIVRLPSNGIYDSLSRIAGRRLGDQGQWPTIWALNKGSMMADGRIFTNPNLIRPGWVLRLPPSSVPAPVSAPPDHLPTTNEPSRHGGHTPSTAENSPPISPPPTSPPPSSPGTPTTSTTHAPAMTAPHNGHPRGAAGIDLPTGAFVSAGLAAAVSTAMAAVWIWRRRRYRIGSGERSDLLQPIAPVVRALRVAHEHALETGIDPDTHDVEELALPKQYDPRTDVTARSTPTNSASERTAIATVTRVGVRAGRDVALNLASTQGLGLVGPGTISAARALLVGLLAEYVPPSLGHRGARVLIPAADVRALLGGAVTRAPTALQVTRDLDAALDELETLLLTRTRHVLDGPHHPASACDPVVLVATPEPHTERRLQAILDNGAPLGIAGVLLGQWRPGGTVRVREDGTVAVASPTLGDALTGLRLFSLPAPETTDLLDLLYEAAGPDDADAQAATADHVAPDVNPHGTAGQDTRVNEPTAPTAATSTPHPTSDGPSPDQADELPPHDLTDSARSPRRPTPTSPAGHEAGVTDADRPRSTHRVRVLTPPHRATVPSPMDAPTAAPPRPRQAPAPDPGPPEHPRSATPRDLTVAGHQSATTAPTTEQRDDDHRDTAASPLSLRVLGHVTLVWAGTGPPREITDTLVPKLREVLVYLALHPRGERRDPMNNAIWPDRPAERPFNNFYSGLSKLRRAINTATDREISDIVLNQDSRYRLNPELVDVDYWQFRDALTHSHAALGEPERLDILRQAVTLYRGELAVDLQREWIEPQREAIRREALDAVATLIAAQGEADPTALLDLLHHARQLDPYNEELYRRMLRIQTRLGQQTDITDTVALLAAALADIDQQPSANILRLAAELQHPGAQG